jgi:hypothetical protein
MPLAIDVIAVGCVVASFRTFFSMPWSLLAFPSSPGVPDELRLMNRLYLAAKLGTRASRERKATTD